MSRVREHSGEGGGGLAAMLGVDTRWRLVRTEKGVKAHWLRCRDWYWGITLCGRWGQPPVGFKDIPEELSHGADICAVCHAAACAHPFFTDEGWPHPDLETAPSSHDGAVPEPSKEAT